MKISNLKELFPLDIVGIRTILSQPPVYCTGFVFWQGKLKRWDANVLQYRRRDGGGGTTLGGGALLLATSPW